MQKANNKVIVKARKLGYKIGSKTVLHDLDFDIRKGETFAITGASGSGKTTLAQIIAQKLPPGSGEFFIQKGLRSKWVPQQDHFLADSGLRVSYYSQRYENQNEETVPSVSNYLQKRIPETGQEAFSQLLHELGVDKLAQRKILSLSNGERKRVQLAETLLQKPDVLILDQPFIGLDTQSRDNLFALLERQKQAGVTLVLVSEYSLIPPFADQTLELGQHTQQHSAADSPIDKASNKNLNFTSSPFSPQTNTNEKPAYHFVVKMKDVKVSLGGETILSGINWEVKTGEKWLLRGHNGAGKTTLLSLISADNPQGYSNDLVLFDRQRGSGESIWEIKAKIGFVSPELHLYFMRRRGLYKAAASTAASYNALRCIDVVLSGYKDEIGFSTSRSKLQVQHATQWLQLLNMEHHAHSPFSHVSLGEQRIILLARALIKTPALLILDEPCQGLDPTQSQRFVAVLDKICTQENTTLIYVTHRNEVIPPCITHFMELEKGRTKTMGLADHSNLLH